MFSIIIFGLFTSVHARTVYQQELDQPALIDVVQEDVLDEQEFEQMHPAYVNRVRRQLSSMSTNPDGSANLNLKVPIARSESNVLSAVGSASGIKSADAFRATGIKPGPRYSAVGGGLALDDTNGHGLSVTGQHIPGLGNQATAAGRLRLINTPDHKLGANAFVTRTMLNIPNFPDFSTHGGSMDYTFKDKIGGSLSMVQTDLFKKTEYSAMGKLNLYRNPSSSLDLNAGFTRSQSPIPAFNHNWAPQAGLTFTKYF